MALTLSLLKNIYLRYVPEHRAFTTTRPVIEKKLNKRLVKPLEQVTHGGRPNMQRQRGGKRLPKANLVPKAVVDVENQNGVEVANLTAENESSLRDDKGWSLIDSRSLLHNFSFLLSHITNQGNYLI